MLLKRLIPYAAIYFVIETMLRISLLVRSAYEIDYGIKDIAKALVFGAWHDLVAFPFFMIPILVYQLLMPRRLYGSKVDIVANVILLFCFSFVLLFDAVAEHIFWTEFSSRFNFIAVDYLIYTNEVIGNIIESFPIYKLLLAIAIASALITLLLLKICKVFPNAAHSFMQRLKASCLTCCLIFVPYALGTVELTALKHNAEAVEVASNGVYSLFSAFWNNEIDYDRFYAKQDEKVVKAKLGQLLSPDRKMGRAGRPEVHANVIIVVMESMSAEYMRYFGNTKNLTPNLDSIAERGVFFTQMYATGTRTVRGLEAITLSLPPTPGQSIVRRPGNSGMFSIGSVFRSRGYDTKFIYGGFGYFDNMNPFFEGNGFQTIDRANMDSSEIEFANIWGVCDEDLFKRALAEADKSYNAGKKFFELVMTTSNHRPFTFPNNKIDIPSHSGREGGVKYADYSIGQFLEQAAEKKWFDDTVFIFIADHTAGAGGKAELNPAKYHIPAIFYSPKILQPHKLTSLASQIDIAPTLFGMLNFSYRSKFFGRDLLDASGLEERTFISNYQKIGLVQNGRLTVLAPNGGISQYSWPAAEAVSDIDQGMVDAAIAYYQSASKWRKTQREDASR